MPTTPSSGPTAQIGVTGLAVMGSNLARNFARHGHTVAVHNRTAARTRSLVDTYGEEGTFVPAESAEEFVASLEKPRRIVIMVKAGEATDAVIEEFAALLEDGDVLIDGGNAHFQDTRRREKALRERGIHFVGTGISGGEEGALNGPSMMPGGSVESYTSLGPLLESIAAKADDGAPCCTHIGPDGAGHFVKMVHNGIEYADMQLIGEAYQLLRDVAGYSPRRSRTSSAPGTPGAWTPTSSRSPPRSSRTSTRRPGSPSWTWCSTRPSRRGPAGGPCRSPSTWASPSPASPRPSSPAPSPATPTSATPHAT